MKRILSALLALFLLLSLCACDTDQEGTTRFYYQRTNFQYGSGTEDGVIAPEKRNITGHGEDLSYLVSLYLAGPLDEELVSPFPKDVRTLRAEQIVSRVYVELSDVGTELSDAQFSLACACLSLTLLDLTNAYEVTIVSGERSLSLTRDQLTLADNVTENDATLATDTEVSQ